MLNKSKELSYAKVKRVKTRLSKTKKLNSQIFLEKKKIRKTETKTKPTLTILPDSLLELSKLPHIFNQKLIQTKDLNSKKKDISKKETAYSKST